MKKNRLPKGWNEERVQKVLRHYENQTEEQAAAEDDKMFSGRQGTIMTVPTKLVPRVRKMIAQHAARERGAKWRSRKDTTSESRQR